VLKNRGQKKIKLDPWSEMGQKDHSGILRLVFVFFILILKIHRVIIIV